MMCCRALLSSSFGLLALFSCAAPLEAQSLVDCRTPGAAFSGVGPVNAVSEIDVLDEVIVEDVEVSTAITHAFIGDVNATVTSPDSTVVTLHGGQGGSGINIVVTWSDAGIINGSPYDCACLMQPAGPGAMSDFAGQSALGRWTFVAADTVAPDDGTLDEWCLILYGQRSRTSAACISPADTFGGIGSPSSITSTITILEDRPIEKPQVFTDVAHTSGVESITVSISSPQATSVTLHNLNGGGTALEVYWSDDGGFNGAFPSNCNCLMQPIGPGSMSDFIGESPAGGWTLTCEDVVSVFSTGTLETWCVRMLCTPAAELCSEPALPFGSVPVFTSDSIDVTVDLAITDLEIATDISHTFISDVIATATSPLGTSVTLHNGVGGSADDIFVTWSDAGAANGSPYNCHCPMTPAGPGLMQDFRGEPSLGAWTLVCDDSVPFSDDGTLDRWCVRLFGTRTPFDEKCSAPALSFGGPGFPDTITDVIAIADSVPLRDVEVFLDLTHTFLGDAVISIGSPAGTEVTLFNQSVLFGTILLTWSDLGRPFGTPLDCSCLVRPSGPGVLGDYDGESAAGDWTLSCVDTFPGSGAGTLNSWCLRGFVIPAQQICSTPALGFGAADLGFPTSISDNVTVIEKLTIGELEARTDLSHAFIGDITMSLTSPAATAVTLHSTGGGGANGVFATWTDRGRANGAPYNCRCAMEPSGPGAMGDFANESASGLWILDCVDSFPDTGGGPLDAWCLRIYEAPGDLFLRGDANGNGTVVVLIDVLFLLQWQFSGGPAPPCFDAADFDGNNAVNALLDSLYLLNYQFSSGPVPPAPGPTICGPDNDDDVTVLCATPPAACNP